MVPVLVANDHGFIRGGVEAVLRGGQFQIVGVTAGGEEALAAIATHNPAIVLVDLNMPGMNGVQTLGTLHAKGDGRLVVLLTAGMTDRQFLTATRAGVQGIFCKDGAESELLDVLDKVYAGQKAIAASYLQRELSL